VKTTRRLLVLEAMRVEAARVEAARVEAAAG
jgi:hypothetical protein